MLEWLLVFGRPTAASQKTKAKLDEYGSLAAQRAVKGGLPFIVRKTPSLVADVLTAMSFRDHAENTCPLEAVDTFCTMNEKVLFKLGPNFWPPSTGDTASKEAALHKVFCADNISQEWRAPYIDADVRKRLGIAGAAPYAEVRIAMENFLRRKFIVEEKNAPSNYSTLVMLCIRYWARGHPTQAR